MSSAVQSAVETKPNKFANISFWALLLSATVVLSVMLFTEPEPLVTGWLALALSLTLLFLGVHVAVASALSALLGLWVISGPIVAENALGTVALGSTASWSLTVIPMFVLMGFIMARTNLSDPLFTVIAQWFRRVPGSLAVATNFAGAGLASASGSSVGISYALGRIAIPQMMRAGYAPSLAVPSVITAGILGQLIPPAVLLVIYAGVAGTPVGPQILAAVIPALLLALAFAATVVIRVMIKPSLAPKQEAPGIGFRASAMNAVRVWPIPVIVLIVVGGMFSGVLTATEAGAAGAFVALLFGCWNLRKQGAGTVVRAIVTAVRDTVSASAGIFLLLIGIDLLNRIITLSGVARQVTNFVAGIGLGKVAFLLLLVVFYVLLGIFLDGLALVVLTVPILLPILIALDVNLIWFGVFVIFLAELGVISPPIGMLIYVVHNLAQDPTINLGRRVSIGDVFKGLIPFCVSVVVIVVILIAWPDLALWLPMASSN